MLKVEFSKHAYYKTSRFVIKPRSKTVWHNHHETEVFIVVSGKGSINIDGVSSRLIPGKIIRLSPLQGHIITNTSDRRDLVICNFWWNDEHFYSERIKYKSMNVREIDQPGDVNYILPSFTTPNGNLHLGHLAGPVLAGDILKRIFMLNGVKVSLLTGTLGYQAQVQVEADKLGKSYLETALHYSEKIKKSMNDMAIDPDCYVTLNDKGSLSTIAIAFVKRLLENGYLQLKEDDVLFCETCNKYLFEGRFRGFCPHCASTLTAECENCYEYVHEKDVINPVCICCEKRPILRKMNRYFFSLEKFKHVVHGLSQSNSYTGLSRYFVEKFLNKALPDIPMTIFSADGIAFDCGNESGHVICSAVELVPRFLVAVQAVHGFQADVTVIEAFLAMKKVNLTLAFGVDNLYLRCIIFPILLYAFNHELVNNISFLCNDFYNLEGSKFSTSRGHVLSVEDVSHISDIETLRYYLVMTRPEYNRTNFSIDKYLVFTKSGSLKRYLDMADAFIQSLYSRYADGTPTAGEFDNPHYTYQLFMDSIIPQIVSSVRKENVNIVGYVSLVNMLIEATYSFFEAGLNTRMNASLERTYYALCAKGIFSLSILIQPICPNKSMDIQRGLLKSGARDFYDFTYLNRWITEHNYHI